MKHKKSIAYLIAIVLLTLSLSGCRTSTRPKILEYDEILYLNNNIVIARVEGNAIVYKDGKAGDKAYDIVPLFDGASYYSANAEYYAAKRAGNSGYELMDSNGKFVLKTPPNVYIKEIKPIYNYYIDTLGLIAEEVRCFYAETNAPSPYTIINKNGSLSGSYFDELSYEHDGFILGKIENNYYVLNDNGNSIHTFLSPVDVIRFDNGAYVISLEANDKIKLYSMGNELLGTFDDVTYFKGKNEFHGSVSGQTAYYLINSNGEVEVTERLELEYLDYSLALIKDEDTYSLINHLTGKKLLDELSQNTVALYGDDYYIIKDDNTLYSIMGNTVASYVLSDDEQYQILSGTVIINDTISDEYFIWLPKANKKLKLEYQPQTSMSYNDNRGFVFLRVKGQDNANFSDYVTLKSQLKDWNGDLSKGGIALDEDVSLKSQALISVASFTIGFKKGTAFKTYTELTDAKRASNVFLSAIKIDNDDEKNYKLLYETYSNSYGIIDGSFSLDELDLSFKSSYAIMKNTEENYESLCEFYFDKNELKLKKSSLNGADAEIIEQNISLSVGTMKNNLLNDTYILGYYIKTITSNGKNELYDMNGKQLLGGEFIIDSYIRDTVAIKDEYGNMGIIRLNNRGGYKMLCEIGKNDVMLLPDGSYIVNNEIFNSNARSLAKFSEFINCPDYVNSNMYLRNFLDNKRELKSNYAIKTIDGKIGLFTVTIKEADMGHSVFNALL